MKDTAAKIALFFALAMSSTLLLVAASGDNIGLGIEGIFVPTTASTLGSGSCTGSYAEGTMIYDASDKNKLCVTAGWKTLQECVATESTCNDSVDEDCDGNTDCADSNCCTDSNCCKAINAACSGSDCCCQTVSAGNDVACTGSVCCVPTDGDCTSDTDCCNDATGEDCTAGTCQSGGGGGGGGGGGCPGGPCFDVSECDPSCTSCSFGTCT